MNLALSWHKLQPLLPLTLGGFCIGMTEFLMMGVLPDVAHSLNVSIPAAGYLIAIYALGVVIGAPLMIALTEDVSPKKILAALMLMFAVFNGLFAFAPTYNLLLLTRFLAGLPHGAFFGIGSVVATRLLQPGQEARAIAIMFSGLTLANIIGVPLGTFLGHHLSWRMAYLLVALGGFFSLISISTWLPEVSLPVKTNFWRSLALFKQGEIWLIIGISAIGTGGLFAWISYIAPLMTEVVLFSANTVTAVMMIAGIGMALGNLWGGRLADNNSPLWVTGLLLLLMVACLFMVAQFTQNKAVALMMTLITGAVAFAVVPAMQMLMIQAAKGREMLASAMVQSSSNMGNTLGAFLGGLPIAAGFGYTSPEYIGMLLAGSGFLLCTVISRVRETNNESLSSDVS